MPTVCALVLEGSWYAAQALMFDDELDWVWVAELR